MFADVDQDNALRSSDRESVLELKNASEKNSENPLRVVSERARKPARHAVIDPQSGFGNKPIWVEPRDNYPVPEYRGGVFYFPNALVGSSFGRRFSAVRLRSGGKYRLKPYGGITIWQQNTPVKSI